MCIKYLAFCFVLVYAAEKNNDNLKDEFCTDPRTMRKHAAYTEWADAYSCTRHRCQPGGRNLAIYTVGCKRVEAPESAIECEEVVEDTNMQFPYCCTRLRCLVVVRGEVWTRVLGQPWETLPAAPWSHMYKMKKPPPVDGEFLPKGPTAGPVYELSQEPPVDRRAGLEKDCDKPKLRASTTPASVPDIVIALTTNNEKKPTEAEIDTKFLARADEDQDQPNEIEAEEAPTFTEKVPEIVSEERTYDKKRSRDPKKSLFGQEASYEYTNLKNKETKQKMSLFGQETSDEYTNSKNKEKKQKMSSLFGQETSDEYTNSKKKLKKQKANAISDEFFTNTEKNAPRGPTPWDQIPPKQWNTGLNARASPDHVESEEKADKPASLQHLVNAIGTRMRDIESVVQKMSEKVQPESAESRRADRPIAPHPKSKDSDPAGKAKSSVLDYNTFPLKQGGSKYLHGAADATSEPPLFVGDRMSGYFSDPSNNLLRRSMADHGPKEPQETYMAPVNNDHHKPATDSAEPEIKHKKRAHKKKKSKHSRRKHHREDREKEFSKVTEDKNAVSLEDSNDLGTGTTQKIVEEPEPEQLEETYQSHLGSTPPVNYWAMPNSPIAAPMKNRPITHRHHNRPGRVRLGFDTASRNVIINNMRKLRTDRNKYKSL